MACKDGRCPRNHFPEMKHSLHVFEEGLGWRWFADGEEHVLENVDKDVQSMKDKWPLVVETCIIARYDTPLSKESGHSHEPGSY